MPTRALNVAARGSPLGGKDYRRKILSYGPIAYWMLAEAAGGVAYDEVTDPNHLDINQSGDHVGVTLGQPGIGDGRTCPFYDGANDYTDIYSAILNGAFDGAEGTALAWLKVFNAGVWIDGAARNAVRLHGTTATNLVAFRKDTTSNQVTLRYIAGGTIKDVVIAVSAISWIALGLTWSASADEIRGYLNGVQQGATLTGLGTWAGVLSTTEVCIGAADTIPQAVTHGYVAHSALWDSALAPAIMADLAAVP